MRHRADVRTVGNLLDVLDGLDPTTPLVWEYDAPGVSGLAEHATVEARPAAVFIDLGIYLGENWW